MNEAECSQKEILNKLQNFKLKCFFLYVFFYYYLGSLISAKKNYEHIVTS